MITKDIIIIIVCVCKMLNLSCCFVQFFVSNNVVREETWPPQRVGLGSRIGRCFVTLLIEFLYGLAWIT